MSTVRPSTSDNREVPASSGDAELGPVADPSIEPVDEASLRPSDPLPTEMSGPEATPLDGSGDADLEGKTVISSPGNRPPSSAGTRTTVLPIGLQGSRLAHYEVLEFVGGGGMGAVYRGHDTKLDRPVAIKVLARESTGDAELVRRFQNEARSAARLDHDNIARVYDFGEDALWHYIVFEFVEGQNIRDLVQQSGPLEVADAMHYTHQLAMALYHAAQREVVHRDIKPSNVVLNQSDHVKLVDMGLARLPQIDSREDLTASGVTLGTFDYISPEQARDPRVADVRSDIYSLGCTLFFMLTGSPPFPHGTALQKLLSHSNDPAPDPREFRSDVPAEVVAVLQRMMAKDPRQRYQDPREIMADISQLSQRFGWDQRHHFAAVIVQSSERPVGFWERQLAWVGPLLILGAVVVGAELWSRGRGRVSFQAPQFVVPPAPAASAGSTSVPRRGDTGDAQRSPSRSDQRSTSPSNDTESVADATQRSASAEPSLSRTESPAIAVSANDSTESQHFDANTTDRSSASSAELTGAAGTGSATAPSSGTGSSVEGTPVTVPIDATGTPPRSLANTGASAADVLPPGSPADDTIQVDPNLGRESDSAATRRRVVSTLAMALSIASQDPAIKRIELVYNGRLRAEAQSIVARDLQLVAGTGYSPIVVFQPDPDAMPVTETFLRLVDSRVRVQNVHFELELPHDSFVPWSLMRLEPGCDVSLVGVTVTVRAAAVPSGTPPDIALFSVHPRSATTAAAATREPFEAEPKPGPIILNLSNCIVRGPVSVVRATESTPLALDWENGLIASSDRLAYLGGTSRVVDADSKVRIRLSHVTALLQRGLCLLTNNQRFSNLIPLDLQCEDSILLARAGAPLVEQRGTASSERFQRQVTFTGHRNFYEGFDAMWKIASVSEPERTWNATAWRTYWRTSENTPRFDMTEWVQPPPWQLPADLHAPYDYRLSDSASNPALRSAADFRDAGFGPNLPSLPSDPDHDVAGPSN